MKLPTYEGDEDHEEGGEQEREIMKLPTYKGDEDHEATYLLGR